MKTHILSLILLLTACTTPKKWTYSEVVSKTPQFSSTLLQYEPDDEQIGVGVELLKGSFGIVGYLNVQTCKIPSLPDEPNASLVVFAIEDEKIPYKAERMEGGQKLRLPDAAIEKLICALQNSQSVTIYLDGYMSVLETSNFSKASKKFF